MAPELVALLAAVVVILVLAAAFAWAGWSARGRAADATEQMLGLVIKTAHGELERAITELDAERDAAKARADGAREDFASDRTLSDAVAGGDLDGVRRHFPDGASDSTTGEQDRDANAPRGGGNV